MNETQALALALAREWQQVIAALAEDTVECLEIVKEIEFNPEIKGHPFYLGKMSLLKTLRELADADVKRFETPETTKLLADMERAHVVLTVDHDLRAQFRYMLRYVPQEEYDGALARLQAYEAIVK